MKDKKQYRRGLIKNNVVEITVVAVANSVASFLSLTLLTDISLDLSKDLLAATSALLGISTATLVFFGDYVQKTTSWLFEKREVLSEFKNALDNMGKVFLRLIFLQFVLFWSLITLGVSTVLMAASVYFVHLKLGSVISLALFMDGLLTIIIWMTLFVLSNTPGRSTYNALVDEIKKTDKPPLQQTGPASSTSGPGGTAAKDTPPGKA